MNPRICSLRVRITFSEELSIRTACYRTCVYVGDLSLAASNDKKSKRIREPIEYLQKRSVCGTAVG